MTLQEVFYFVAIIFMSLTTILLIIVIVAFLEIYGYIKRTVKLTTEFTNEATESGRRLLEQAESTLPKIIQAWSLTEVARKILKEYFNWQKDRKSNLKN